MGTPATASRRMSLLDEIGTFPRGHRGLSRAVVRSSRDGWFRSRGQEAELAAVTVGPLEWLDGPVTLHEYDSRWTEWFARERQRIRDALGERVLLLEHVGSTSVPDLMTKLVVSACEALASRV